MKAVPEFSSVDAIVNSVTDAIQSASPKTTINVGRVDGAQPCGMTTTLLKAA